MRCLLILSSSLVLSAPAAGEIRDIILSQDGGVAWIQLEFDTTPTAAEWDEATGTLAVTVSGVTAGTQRVEPVSNTVMSQIAFETGDAGLRAVFTLEPGWQGSRVHIDGHRVIVRVSGDGRTPMTGANAAADAQLVSPDTLTMTPAQTAEAPEADAPPADTGRLAATNLLPEDEALPAGPDGPGNGAPDTGTGADDAVSADLTDAAAATRSAAATSACREADEQVTDDPWDLDALIVQAGCARANGDSEQALALLERVTAMDPERFTALLMLAEVEAESGNRSEARALYELAARNARTDGEAGAAMARARALAD